MAYVGMGDSSCPAGQVYDAEQGICTATPTVPSTSVAAQNASLQAAAMTPSIFASLTSNPLLLVGGAVLALALVVKFKPRKRR